MPDPQFYVHLCPLGTRKTICCDLRKTQKEATSSFYSGDRKRTSFWPREKKQSRFYVLSGIMMLQKRLFSTLPSAEKGRRKVENFPKNTSTVN